MSSRQGMEPLIVLSIVKGVIENAQSTYAFVKEDMVSVLREIGDIHYRAAICSLQDAKKSSDPRREIESALTCLRQAFIVFKTAGEKQGFVSGLLQGGFGFGRLDIRSKPHRRAYETALLIATTYYALADRKLTKDYCKKARESFARYKDERINAYPRVMVSTPRSQYEFHTIPTRQNPDGIAEVEGHRNKFEEIVNRLEKV